MAQIPIRAKGSIRNPYSSRTKGSIYTASLSSVNAAIGTSARYPIYTGPLIFTSSDVLQTIYTANLNVPGNITILPIDLALQQKAVEPSVRDDLEITADEQFFALEKVTVLKIPYQEIDNVPGGKTVIIGQ